MNEGEGDKRKFKTKTGQIVRGFVSNVKDFILYLMCSGMPLKNIVQETEVVKSTKPRINSREILCNSLLK